MKITAMKLYRVPLTSHVTYTMADGKVCDTVPTMVLELTTDGGISGWGEVCPIPHYLEAYPEGVEPVLGDLAEVVVGADALASDALMERANAHLKGHVYAKSVLSMALWDALGKAAGMPLYALLGGRHQESLPLYHSITCCLPGDMARMAREAHKEGIRQFQVKLGADKDNEADIARLVQVREAVGNGPLVYGDWNGGSTRLDATRVGRAVRHLDIMLEQPCATLEECAAVKTATGLPMKIDENAFDTASLLEARSLGCLDAVALKTSKFGGIHEMRRARDLCCHLGAKMCIEDTWGSDLVTSAALHVGASTPSRYLLNVCDLSGYVAPRLDPKAPARKDGRIAPPEGPGIGVEPDRDALGEPVAVID